MPRWIRLAVLALSCSGSACGTARTTATPATVPAPASSIRLQRVDIGGGQALHIECQGRERPVVVLDSGLGEGVEAWSLVQRHVAAFARVCAYDRAGHGRSDPFRFPHSNRQMARELFALLEKVRGDRPVRPRRTLDGRHQCAAPARGAPRERGRHGVARFVSEPAPIGKMPPALVADFEQNLKRLEGLDVKTWLAGFDELRASKRSLGDKPLLILVAGKPQRDPNFTPEQAQEMLAARRREQQPLVSLSSNAAFVTVPEWPPPAARGTGGRGAGRLRRGSFGADG